MSQLKESESKLDLPSFCSVLVLIDWRMPPLFYMSVGGGHKSNLLSPLFQMLISFRNTLHRPTQK
jgi:hypothetical protein